jgi:hypothetical protein
MGPDKLPGGVGQLLDGNGPVGESRSGNETDGTQSDRRKNEILFHRLHFRNKGLRANTRPKAKIKTIRLFPTLPDDKKTNTAQKPTETDILRRIPRGLPRTGRNGAAKTF